METKAIRQHEHGGVEVLQLETLDVGAPGPGEVRIRQHACGVNFIDIYHRQGLYPLPLPHGLGLEAAGVVDAVGDGVEHVSPGDRVAYVSTTPGAYAELRNLPASFLCPLPDDVSFEDASSIMVQGLTVELLFNRISPVRAGDTVLFHAAAGGVGLVACQWARSEGVRLIGTAGSDEKCAQALALGASEMVNYRRSDFVQEVKRLTDGEGVDVVMDGVGKDTFMGSLDCLRPLGTMISFGNASGMVPPLDIMELAVRGSLKVTRPILLKHIGDPDLLAQMSRILFEKMRAGAVVPQIGLKLGLKDAASAQEKLAARSTMGSIVLTC
ncbi:quinone oxidoreductase family protein [Tropicimonas marinistellae]|uniref:quinone oxidoreductase family protein n=1 Tax=Tropicimonas marinistellae TaxID=1739787 RepID=UPI0008375A8B|nr:quinone oxidoreductase [Tropicimonas marinistellae]